MAKITRIFSVTSQHRVTNIAKIARITYEKYCRLRKEVKKGPREGRKFSENRKRNKDFSCYLICRFSQD